MSDVVLLKLVGYLIIAGLFASFAVPVAAALIKNERL